MTPLKISGVLILGEIYQVKEVRLTKKDWELLHYM